jgi:ribosomal protein L2
MADRLKRYKPTTPSQRHRVHVVRPYLWKGRYDTLINHTIIVVAYSKTVIIILMVD